MKLSKEAQNRLYDKIVDCMDFCDEYGHWYIREKDLERLLNRLNLIFKPGDSSQSELEIE